MQIKVFTIPISDDGSAQNELNRFLASHKVLKTESNFYAADNGAAWCFCVSFLPSTLNNSLPVNDNKKIDYKNLLSETAFATFSDLRIIRKQLASQDAVPAYAVFTTNCRVANRNNNTPSNRNHNYGFRVVLSQLKRRGGCQLLNRDVFQSTKVVNKPKKRCVSKKK